MVVTQTAYKIKKLGLDNGEEYKLDHFLKIYWKKVIVTHFIVSGTPQQNRVVECMNCTSVEKVRCMLSHARLSKAFWSRGNELWLSPH